MIRLIQELNVKSYLLADDGSIPNNPKLPLLVYAGALQLKEHGSAAACEKILKTNLWGSSWRNGIYSYHHYHSTAHEVLIIAQGTARVHFGGEHGPMIDVQSGDVVVVPAGVGHKNLGASRDLLVVGAYPTGQKWDLCRGVAGERPWALQNIANVPLPLADPIYGDRGPLITQWLS